MNYSLNRIESRAAVWFECYSQLMLITLKLRSQTPMGALTQVYWAINLSLSKQVLCVSEGPAGYNNTPTTNTHTNPCAPQWGYLLQAQHLLMCVIVPKRDRGSSRTPPGWPPLVCNRVQRSSVALWLMVYHHKCRSPHWQNYYNIMWIYCNDCFRKMAGSIKHEGSRPVIKLSGCHYKHGLKGWFTQKTIFHPFTRSPLCWFRLWWHFF